MANLNFNKAILGGRLTADPDVKMTQSGQEVVTFTVAINRPKSKDGGEQQSDFITCTAWRDRAKMIGQYFKRGSSILVEGEIQTRKWQDAENKTRYATEVLVSRVCFVDSKAEASPATTNTVGAPDAYTPPAFKQPEFTDLDKNDDLPF